MLADASLAVKARWHGWRFSTLEPAPWLRNFRLFADGPNRALFEFAMVRDAGDLVRSRAGLSAVRAAFGRVEKRIPKE
jgi:hypothetical protein